MKQVSLRLGAQQRPDTPLKPGDPAFEHPTAEARRATSDARHRVLPTLVDLLVILLIMGYVLALLPGLTRFPPLINDEGREANLFWVASGAEPDAQRMNAHRGFATWGTGGLQGATTAALFRLGGVGVFQARLTSLLWGGLLLIAVYLLGRLYWGRAVGLAAVALLAVSNPFLLSTHTLRPDIQVATLTVGALALAEWGVARGPPWAALLAGLSIGLSVDTHLNSIGFIPLVGLVFPLRQGWPRVGVPRAHGVRPYRGGGRDARAPRWGFLGQREAWLFGAGLAGAAVYYLAVRVLPDPAGFATAMGYWLGVDKAPPATRGGAALVGMLGAELARYWDYFGEEPLELGLVLLGLGAGLWWAVRGSHPARLILLGLGAAFIFFVLAVSMKSKFYMLLTYPFYLLLVARLLERVAVAVGSRLAVSRLVGATRRSPRLEGSDVRATGRSPLPVMPVTHLVLAGLVTLVALIPLRAEERAWDNYIRARRYREGQEYTALTTQLDRLAGPDARVMAPPLYWIGLRNHPYVDIFVYERLERQYGMSVAQFLDETRPDFVITDAKIATESRVEKLLYNELDARAARQFVVRHKSYGDVAVYRLDW